MKKLNKLFAILFAVLGVTTLKAQTDVTSQYLKNANFSSTDGWTQHVSGYKDIGSGNIGGKLASFAASSTDATHLNSEYFFGFQCRWNGNYSSYNQETSELPAGVYTLSYDVQNRNGSTTAASYNNLFYVKVGEKTYTDSYTEWMTGSTGWTSHSITFTITSASKATISLGYGTGANNFSTTNTPVLYVSHLKLEYTSFDDALESGWTAPQVPGTDIASLVGTGVNVGMYNVKADAFTTRAMNWSTQAAATKLHNSDSQTEGTSNRHHVNVVKGSGSTIKFYFPCVGDKTKWLGDGGQGSTKAVFTDNKSQNYEFNYSVVSAKTHVYTLKVATATSEDNAYLDVWQPYGGQLTYAEGQGFTEWAFIRFSDIENGNYATYKAKKALYEIYQAVVAAGHENTYQEELRTAFMTYIRTDVTAADVTAATNVLINAVSPALTAGYVNAGALFTNSDIRGAGTKADWTSGYTSISWGCFENYHTNHGERKLTQTKSVPNGFYKVVFHGIWRQDGSDAAPTLTLRSGDNSVSANVPCMTDIDFGVGNINNNNWTNNNGKIVPNGMQSAGEGLSHGNAQVTISDFVVSDGELTIEMNSSSTSQWILAQGFDIYFKAESLEEYANLFYAAKSAAEAIDQNTLNIYAKNTLITALNNAATEQIDKAWYQEHTAALNDAVTIANDIATTYPKTNALLTICNDILDNSVEFEDGAKETFSGIVSTASENVAIAQTSAAINDIYNTLEAARQTYVVKADPINDTYFDYTFLMTNPEVSTESHWTNGRYNTGQQYTGAPDNRYLDSWNGASQDIYQAVEELPNGYYTVKAAGRASTTCTSAYIYLNDTKVEIDKAGSTDNDLGNGWKWYTTAKTLVDGVGTAKIGFACNSTEGQWAGADDFHFYYYGYDVVSAQNTVTYLKSGIEGRRSSKMSSAVREQMETAYNNADASKTTRKELEPMIAALRTAIDAVDVSIAEYEKILGYINMTKVFTDVTTYETKYNDGEYTTEDVEPVRQELNVLRFNAASEIFPNKIEVTGWEGSMGGKNTSGQHWDGTDTKYYDNNSWNGNAHSTTTSIELPKGTYVLKAALRSSANTTLTLTVLDQIVNVEGKGDTGYGVDTKGNANFSSDGSYANNNAGRGWEWEFVKFELEETTTVTLKVECNYNGVYGWASFSDITLWMDDETYMTVYGHAINEPLAAAKALVDTKPMGTDENDALKAAIVLGENVSTAIELDEAIEALETAVANANTWVAEYNAAKAPLVAALERFETDYNDGANGCLYHLQKAAWSTVIEKVQAAAEAKDVTNSYAGFQTAADNLNAALDAAQTSINMYANFAAEISYAKAYTPIVTENAAAHNAAITAAENAYDAAETDDASALIFAMQNYRALDYEHVKGTYTSEVTLGNWSGKTNQSEKGKSEHWSGDANITYFDYSRWSGNAGEYEATQTITLPAGDYVLMAAGRAATVAGTEAYIKVNDTKVNFAAKGSYGLGVDTEGKANFAVGTYGRENEGYGWEYRFIEFTLTEEAEVTLVAGMNIADSYNPLSWASVCAPVLFTTPLDAAKNDLQTAIKNAENALSAYPVGEEAFQVSETSELYVALKNAIATAQNVLDNATTTDALTLAIDPLNTAVNEYTNGYVLNAPAEGQRFYIKVATEGHGKLGNAWFMTLGATGANNPTGYGLNANNAAKGYLAQAFIFTQVEGNLYNISIERPEGRVYLTYGSLNGSAAGWKNQQIQATTNAENKGEFKIEATAKEGVLKIFNTVDNNYIDCQNGGSIYTDTDIKNEEFAFELAPEHEVTLKISSVGWATLILPFNAELPTGVVAYESGEVEDDAVQLVSAESLVANTPYLIKGTEGTYNFSGYGLATEDSYTKNLFVGTYVQKDAERGSYVLQNKNGVVAFYQVNPDPAEAPKVPTVGAYRSYMKYTPAEGQAASPMFRIGGSTGIDNTTLPSSEEIVIYDLMGRKVTTMEKGNMYIINGRKVIVK